MRKGWKYSARLGSGDFSTVKAFGSMRMQVIGRSSGRSATAAAYRSGEQVKDERIGQTFDYTGKSDIYKNEILMPETAPERLGNRETLWKAYCKHSCDQVQ